MKENTSSLTRIYMIIVQYSLFSTTQAEK